jgi:LPS export ABC transporter protein LptC
MINFFNFRYLKQAVLITGCLFVFACENSQRSLDEWRESREMVEEATQIEIFFSQNGNMKARMRAPLMLRYSSDTVYAKFPQSLHMVFFDSLGREESDLRSLYGIYYESLNKAYLRDSVVVANIHGDTLWAPDLWWDQNTQKIYTDKNVRIYRKGDRIYGGRGLEAKQDLTDILIRRPTGTVTVPDQMSNQQPLPPPVEQ